MANRLKVAGADSVFKLPDVEPAGFWVGFWHGLILPFTFLVGLFKPGVNIYETNNNGGWYNFGFLLGASSSLGGGSKVNVNRSDEEDDESEE
jgi:hypothetical protein